MTAALLVCCGLATLDVVQVVEHLPGPDEKVVAADLQVTFGGPAANAAATAVALGVRTVLVTALGVGPVADVVRAGLAAAGVEVVDLLETVGSPAVSTVLVTRSTGARAVVSVNATAVGDLTEAATAAVAWVLDDATAVLVDGHHLGAARVIAAAARSAGIPVLLDGGSWKPGLERLLAHVDHAVLSADFAAPGDASDVLDAVAALGPRTVARSDGAGPVRFRDATGDRSDVWPVVVPLADVVDTLGAGDVLHGAIAASLASGVDIGDALRAGVRQASESVRHAGALGWVGR